ncbi:MAG TPA: DUF6455 family protein [Alphaproteobacteria bacterium]
MLELAFFERRANLMRAMLRQLDIDVAQACAQALGTVMQRFARTCALCRNVDACERWLAAPEDPTGYRRFCPNADRLDRLPRRHIPNGSGC